MAEYLFDLESDGLLDRLTKIHSLVLREVTTKEVFSYGPHEVEVGVKKLMEAEKLIGHNVIGFDIPALQKVYPDFAVERGRVFDTLVATRLLYTDLSDTDCGRVKIGKLPAKYRGSQGLAAWGYRLGVLKGTFGETSDWSEWSQEMQDYCEQDVAVTAELYARILNKAESARSLELEHQVAWIVEEQRRHGFLFDTAQAEELYRKLSIERAVLERDLQTAFDPWYSAVEVKTPTKDMIYKSVDRHSVWKGAPYTVIKHNLFNPNSRMHIADRLTAKYGWKPTEVTPDGRPKVDETVLEALPYPEAQKIAHSLMIAKRIGQLAEGKNSLLNMVGPDGRIHGSVNTNGAVTGRMTHSFPNIAQVPAVGKEYGKEFRSLFTVPKGKKLVGVDVSGLELRMLAHFLYPYDQGAYAKALLEEDIHTVNQIAAGLPDRSAAKRFIYAFLYGGGDELIGSIVGGGKKEGKAIKERFYEATPAIKTLTDKCQNWVRKRGMLPGLDGRELRSRSPHSALNLLLQSGGALVCKQWAVEMDKALIREGLKHRCQVVANIHDEHQYECDEEIAERVGQLSIQSIKDAGKFFDIRIELDGEAKIGNNWADTH